MEPNLSLLSKEQLYGSTMSIMSEFLPLPIRHMYFSQYRVHPIVWLLKPKKNKTSLKVKDGVSSQNIKLKYWYYQYDYDDYDRYSLINVESIKILSIGSWHPTWIYGYSQYYHCTDEESYKISVNDKTLIHFNKQSGFEGDMELSEVFCRKTVCSKVLCGCQCDKCDYYGRDKKYQGNHPFDLLSMVDELKTENKFRFEENLPSLKLLIYDGLIIDEHNAHRYYFEKADIKNNENYFKY